MTHVNNDILVSTTVISANNTQILIILDGESMHHTNQIKLTARFTVRIINKMTVNLGGAVIWNNVDCNIYYYLSNGGHMHTLPRIYLFTYICSRETHIFNKST